MGGRADIFDNARGRAGRAGMSVNKLNQENKTLGRYLFLGGVKSSTRTTTDPSTDVSTPPAKQKPTMPFCTSFAHINGASRVLYGAFLEAADKISAALCLGPGGEAQGDQSRET